MSKHTSGTWTARGNTVFTEGDWALSIAVATSLGSLRKAEMNANARLIAAAPDMLEALQKIIDMNVQYCIDRYGDASKAEDMSCVAVARAALAKATGQ